MVIERYGPDRVAESLLPEYERIVRQAQPRWFLRENSPFAPDPVIDGYSISSVELSARHVGNEQDRRRKFWFGMRGSRKISLWPYLEMWEAVPANYEPTVTASAGQLGSLRKKRGYEPRSAYLARSLRVQGVPDDFFKGSPFTAQAQQLMIGNGVPLDMGRAIAQAVRRALAELPICSAELAEVSR